MVTENSNAEKLQNVGFPTSELPQRSLLKMFETSHENRLPHVEAPLFLANGKAKALPSLLRR